MDSVFFNSLDSALRNLKKCIQEGASIIDVGVESTSVQGAVSVATQQEVDRVLLLLTGY